ncbi:uncharacterized protein LOC128234903 isoform X2 [Mya arenaria]|nr:uncharacterized protein LOC128234903 isoform X2 [Mya arenaria]XP_052805478.1 uncharacterized protein LOC128234903 isoform X2 [Mya arenaria]
MGRIRATLPTVAYEALDAPAEKVTPWSILKLCDSIDQSYFWSTPREPGGPLYTPMFYILNLSLDINKAFYDMNTPKFPMTMESRVKYMKRSSCCLEKTLSHPETNQTYVTSMCINVNVDHETRKPTAFEDWWKAKYCFPTEGERQEFLIPDKPDVNVFTSDHRVHFSDTDENGHANFTAYVRYCSDSFHENVLAGRYGKGLDVYAVGLQRMEVTFHNECNVGDRLTICSWQDDQLFNTFYFEVRHGDVLTLTAMMKYY